MKFNNRQYRTIWSEAGNCKMIDQNKLPHIFEIYSAETYLDTCRAIKDMTVRGAGAVGAAAGFAMAQAAMEAPTVGYFDFIRKAKADIESTRPTARNLFQAVDIVYQVAMSSKEDAIYAAQSLANKSLDDCKRIGINGNKLIKSGMNILTHCNAGSLAFVDWGTALAPIYRADRSGKKVFVYVDETRPRLQGGRLTAHELHSAGIAHRIIPDNAAASLMQAGKIDIVITGADRIARNGDTANKIGTLEKAICAREFGIPFYIAAPLSTFDSDCRAGSDIKIEYRSGEEIIYCEGPDISGINRKIAVNNPDSEVLNPGFDVTPAKYIDGFITEEGIFRSPIDLSDFDASRSENTR